MLTDKKEPVMPDSRESISSMRELSGILVKFHFLMKLGLHRYMHLSKVRHISDFSPVDLINDWWLIHCVFASRM